MNVSLTPILEEFVKKKVESGLYNNASEVVRDGLRLLIERDKSSAPVKNEISEVVFSSSGGEE
jgi:putative addiction module CopG family antidote